MATIVFAINMSLDGYVDHDRFGPGPDLFRHWIEAEQRTTASIYGRVTYELMRYWEEDRPGWTADERAFAVAWRANPKWVASRTLREAGPNTTLISGSLEEAVGRLRSELEGEIAVAGPALAWELGQRGLVDEYRLYVHPVVLGTGRPCFPGPVPRLRQVACRPIGQDAVQLVYVPG